MPDPIFSDEDRKMTRNFLTSMALKIKKNEKNFENEEQKIIYYHNWLGPNIWKQFFPYIMPDGPVKIFTVKKSTNIIIRTWGNINLKEQFYESLRFSGNAIWIS